MAKTTGLEMIREFNFVKVIGFFLPVFFMLLNGCQQTNKGYAFSSDTAVIHSGQVLFEKNCASCHSFKNNGIGPNLSGITDKVAAEWLIAFIKNPSALIGVKDKRADSLVNQFKSIMPPFAQLQDAEMTALLAFLHGKKAVAVQAPKIRKGILDPYAEKIQSSGLLVNLVPFVQFPSTATDGNMPVTRITKMDFQPGSNTIFVNDLRGKLYKLKGNKPIVYLEIKKYFPQFVDAPGLASGFGSFAFHPEFNTNGLLYTTHTEPAGSGKADFVFNDSIKARLQWVLTEWKISNTKADTLSGTHRELMRINMVAEAHGVQEIIFNPLARKGSKDYGMLYVGVGDGSSVQQGYPALTRGNNKILGSVIRIDPAGRNSANGKYGIPADNPFALSKTNALREVYANGFRNPHRITWTKSGMMLVCNIGQTCIESIYQVKPGADFGWPVREGNFLLDPYGNLDDIFPLPADDSTNGFAYPIAAYDHDEGSAITGGYEYQGTNVAALQGKFFFGDITSGRLFYINVADIKQGSMAPISEWQVSINGVAQTLKKACGSERVDLRFGRDAKGELYIITKADGMLYRVESAKVEK